MENVFIKLAEGYLIKKRIKIPTNLKMMAGLRDVLEDLSEQ